MAPTREQHNLRYARRCEQENKKIERTEALYRYYDHWGKITSRYENLAGADYYKEAEAKFNKVKENKEKHSQLERRREALRALLKNENSTWEIELEKRQRPQSRRVTKEPEFLEKIKQNTQQTENMRRKLELEAKLYGKWRHGVNDEQLIFDSRSNNEVLAKLNWLDRQIADQEQREKEQAAEEQRNLEMQKEKNKMLEMQKERQTLREKELQEIRKFQEQHMQKLQELQTESEKLSEQENLCRSSLFELRKEHELLQESAKLLTQTQQESAQGYNLRKIKLLLRNRSELVREAIKICCSILERISSYSTQRERLNKLQQMYKDELETEALMLPMIEAMYESEAKSNLQKAEDTWQIAHNARIQQISSFIEDEVKILNKHINEVLQQQEDIVQLRTAYLNALDVSNDNLKALVNEQELDMCATASNKCLPEINAKTSDPVKKPNSSTSNTTERYVPKVTNSFNNLNLDVWKDVAVTVPNSKNRKHIANKENPCVFQVVTAENVERPKFARKRVAWD